MNSNILHTQETAVMCKLILSNFNRLDFYQILVHSESRRVDCAFKLLASVERAPTADTKLIICTFLQSIHTTTQRIYNKNYFKITHSFFFQTLNIPFHIHS